MENEKLIAAEDFCIHHNIELSFIYTLQNSGLISVTTVQHSTYIRLEEINKLEKFVRLHYDMDINIEGIETISYLLHKIEDMQKELITLRNKIDLY